MANTNQAESLGPEIESNRKLLQMFESNTGSPELFMDILNLLSKPTSTLESFLQQLLDKLNKLIPSSSSLIGLVVGESESKGPRVVIHQGNHKIGAMGGRHEYLWPDYPIGGDELPIEQRSLLGYVAFIKQAKVLPDVQRWKKETGFYRQVHEGINSEIAVPILLEGRDVLGVINLESTEKDYFTNNHLYQLQWVACVISRPLYAFMNRAGYRKPYLTILDRIQKELRELRINPDLSSKGLKYLSEDSKAVFDTIAMLVAHALNSARCEIWVQTKKQERLLLEGQYGPDTLTRSELVLDPEAAKQIMEQKSSLCLDSSSSPYGVPTLISPLLVSGRNYGIMIVMSPEAKGEAYRYSLGDERLLDVLQQPISVAIHQKHLEWERRAASFKRQKDVAALLDIITDIDIDLSTVLQRACDKTSQLGDALHCSIFTLDDATGKFSQAASTNLPPRLLNKQFYEPGEGLTGWVCKYGKPLNLRTRHDQDLANINPPIDWNNEEKLLNEDLIDRPFIAVPIQVKGRTVGVLRCTDKRGERATFTEADEQILLLIAAHLATAITFQQHHEGKTRLFRGIKLLLAAVKEQQEGPKPALLKEVLLKELLRWARNISNADSAIIYHYRKGALAKPIRSGQWKDEARVGDSPGDDSIIFDMLDGEEDLHFLPDVSNHPVFASWRANETEIQDRKMSSFLSGVSSAVIAKLGSGQCGKSLLVLTYRDHPQKFNRRFTELLTAFTDIATLCIDIFDMRQDSMEIAAHLHNAIIPELMRDVIAEAGLGAIQLRQKNYVLADDYFDAIESSAQHTVASLSDVVCRLIKRFKGLSAQPGF